MFTIMRKRYSAAMLFENRSDIRNNMTGRFFETTIVSCFVFLSVFSFQEFINVIPISGRPKMYVLKICLKPLNKGNEQFVQKVTFQPLMNFKQNH